MGGAVDEQIRDVVGRGRVSGDVEQRDEVVGRGHGHVEVVLVHEPEDVARALMRERGRRFVEAVVPEVEVVVEGLEGVEDVVTNAAPANPDQVAT